MGDETVIVTGAAGFLGSHVSEALLARGARVVGIDNFDLFYPREHKERNLRQVESAARAAGATFEFVHADIRDVEGIHRIFRSARAGGVIHLAAKAGVRPSIADPAGYALTNVVGTSAVLQAAEIAKCGRIVVASSSSVYGNNRVAPFSEEHDVSFPISPYAATKRACELICHSHHALTGMPTACLRFFTAYGPRQRPDLAISLFLRLIAKGEPIRVFGDGSTARDYTFVRDIITGVLAAYDRVPNHGYRVWNLGSDHPITLSEMVSTAEAVVGRHARVERLPMQPGDVERTWADLSRATKELGYAPTTTLAVGMRAQLEWMRQVGIV